MFSTHITAGPHCSECAMQIRNCECDTPTVEVEVTDPTECPGCRMQFINCEC